MLIFGGVVLALLFACVGYFRGIIQMLISLFCFALAAILAKPCSYLILWIFTGTHIVPKALVPIVGQLSAGLLLFSLFSFAIEFYFKAKRGGSEQPAAKPVLMKGERYTGAALGGAWGVFLAFFILTGIHLIGSVEEAIGTGTEDQAIEESKQSAITPGVFTNLKNEIEASFCGSMVKKADPVEGKVGQIFRDLTIVMKNPELFERFKNHQAIVRFTHDSRMIQLAGDPEIERLLQTNHYYKLLDNEKIASLLNDGKLFKEMKALDMSSILKEVMAEAN
ncbi:MAG: hypothetical protein A4E66_02397 [Syntrophus sp. PtaB.Bin001]|nr:MAG: hypothetical protein A4E66_02397 [Syntrophus sp. PtaB.Bin001]